MIDWLADPRDLKADMSPVFGGSYDTVFHILGHLSTSLWDRLSFLDSILGV